MLQKLLQSNVMVWGRVLIATGLMGALNVTTLHPVFAQSNQQRASGQANQIQRKQKQDSDARARANTVKRNRPTKRGNVPTRPKLSSQLKGERCFQIKSITVDDVKLFSKQTIDQVVSPFEGKCIGLTGINDILKQVTYLYIANGYIASRAYIPEQDLSSGVLTFKVVEGQMSAIHTNGKQANKHRQTQAAFPGMIGRPVNLRDIEQGLDQINRLSMYDAKMQVLPGKKPGDSILGVAIKKAKPFSASISFDNHGQKSTGLYRTSVSAGMDNVLGVLDAWNFSYSRSMANHPLYFSSKRSHSDNYSGGVSVPYGYWSFFANASHSRYLSTIPGAFSLINTSGNSSQVGAGVDRVVHRDQTSKTSVGLNLLWKDTKNYLLGSKIEVGSRSLSILKLEANHSKRAFGGVWTLSAAYERGLNILGAFNDNIAPAGSPKGQFDKLSGNIGLYYPVKLNGAVVTYSGLISGQWSDDKLFGSEQISLGGLSSVRGVRDAVLFGNNGLFSRHDVSVTLPQLGNSFIGKVIANPQVFASIDVGRIFSQAKYAINGGTLSGWSAGVRNQNGKFSFEVAVTGLISAPTGVNRSKVFVFGRAGMAF